MTGTKLDPRIIDTGAPPERFARGWHCLGLAEPFRDGKPHAVEAFGTKLVVWADSEGTLHVLDGYCRHMGGDLTQGTVKGDQIACPFHDWRWGGDGRCKQIPYAKRIPLRARTRSWHADGAQPAALRVARRRGQRPDPRAGHPGHRGARDRGVDRLDVERPRRPQRPLPRDRRQRGGHGPLLLHPLRVPAVLQERLRGPRRHAVHDLQRSPRHGRQRLRRPGPAAGVRGQLLRAVVHDQPAEDDLQGLRDQGDPDQLPLPGRLQQLQAPVRPDGAEARGPRRRELDEDRQEVQRHVRRGLHAGRPHLAQQVADPEPPALRGGRSGLPAAPLVRAVLRRRRRRRRRR